MKVAIVVLVVCLIAVCHAESTQTSIPSSSSSTVPSATNVVATSVSVGAPTTDATTVAGRVAEVKTNSGIQMTFNLFTLILSALATLFF